ncbi:glycosyltransferase family 4 protein, partial [Candidatus Azambacteria bacterium]|nr:glycosyltransferase family 4 protein [Candidatus Azambacteria bacterium]
SERIKKSLVSRVKIHISKIDVLPIFVDVEKIGSAPVKTDLRKKYPQFDFIALMASRFSREKNIPLAIEAFTEVVKKHPRAGLVIVGDGPEESNYETGQNIVVEKWTDDLLSYYKTADVFLLASDYEGYGRTAVEALAAGLPVVMTDAGIAGEVVKDGENGLVTPVGDARAFADAILRIREKRVTLKARMPFSFSKEDYLKRYKDSWEQCGVF